MGRLSKVNLKLAARFHGECGKYNFHWEVAGDSVVRIKTRFTPGDRAAFANADMMGPSLIHLVPAKGGSIWGTDGASVGGYAGLKNGEYVLNVSGVKKAFLAALKHLYNR